MEADFKKGGENWGHIDVDRRSKGIEIWAKLDPRLEELIQGASEGLGSYTNSLDGFGRGWVGMNPTPNIRAYSLDRPLDGPTYVLGSICGPLKDSKGRTNLSFLTFQGIGKPEGVRFMVLGPAQGDYVKEYARNVVRDITYFLREYLVPIHIGINIGISSNL